jgi:uncharacterized protein (TIGR03437 family)
VTIAGFDAPVFAVARGLIAVQVPFEIELGGPALMIEVFQNGQAFQSILTSLSFNALSLFDTGDRNNSLNLPALAALNQDGTVNSVNNPAAAGSVVSLFASGAGGLSPALRTGALSPIPPAGPPSTSSLYQTCFGCTEILYLGSAPGLSTAVAQINIRIPAEAAGSGVRPQGIGIQVSDTIEGLFVSRPTGIVFIK